MQSCVLESGLSAEQAKTVVLVHGLGGNAQSWDVVAESLGQRFHLIRYDLRGHGQSEIPAGPWRLDDFVDDLIAILDRRNLKRIHLVGFSLGGLIGQQMALSCPQRLDQLVILSAIAGRTEAERQKVSLRLQSLEQGDLDTNIDLAMSRWFSPEFRAAHPDRVQQRIRILRATDPDGYLHAHRVFSLSDLGDQLHRIYCPTLIMTGQCDPGSNPRMAQFMQSQIGGSQLEILPGLRHSVLVEAPDLIARKLNQFLED